MKLFTQISLVALTLTLGSLSHAQAVIREPEADRLPKLATTLNQAYHFIGQDNNVVENAFFKHDNVGRLLSSDLRRFQVAGRSVRTRRLPVLDIGNRVAAQDIQQQFARCLFPQRGSRETHVNTEIQTRLAKMAYRHVLQGFARPPLPSVETYLVENVQLSPTTESEESCAILVIYHGARAAVLLQGGIDHTQD